MVRGVIFATATPGEGSEQEFHSWYESEHIPSRLALPGIDGARRFVNAQPGESARFAVRYDISDISVFDTEEFKALRKNPSETSRRVIEACREFDRFAGEEIISQGNTWHAVDETICYSLAFSVPEDFWGEFEAWYSVEHVPMMLEEPLWAGCQIYRRLASDGSGAAPGRSGGVSWSHVALHSLRSREALNSAARERARATPWRHRLSEHAWHRGSVRHIFEPIGRDGAKA